MIQNRNLTNANKIAYLVKCYPEKNAQQILGLIAQMPDLEANAGLWFAQELGWLSELDKDGKFTLLNQPEQWMFGDDVDTLEDIAMYAFRKLAKNETDLEEYQFNEWFDAYYAHDVFVVTNKLLEDKVIATYEIEDTDAEGVVNTYTFYTTYENSEMRWGEKAFAKKPVAPKFKRKG